MRSHAVASVRFQGIDALPDTYISRTRALYQGTVARAISDDLTLSDHSTGVFFFLIALFPQRRLRWALLSVAGSIVCVSGAWPMRSARNSMEKPAAIVCKPTVVFVRCPKAFSRVSGMRLRIRRDKIAGTPGQI